MRIKRSAAARKQPIEKQPWPMLRTIGLIALGNTLEHVRARANIKTRMARHDTYGARNVMTAADS